MTSTFKSRQARLLAAAFNIRLVRFGLVGIVNTAFSYLVYALLLYSGLDYRLANIGALLAGVLFGFNSNGRVVFRNREPGRFWRYLLLWISLYLVNILLIAQLMKLSLNAYEAGAVALVPMVIASYIFQKTLVFGPDEKV